MGYFANTNAVMMLSMFVVAAGFNRTRFLKTCALSVNKIAKGSLTMIMFGYVLITVLLCQFIQSSMVVFGLMAPMLAASCAVLNVKPSKVMFPLMLICISTISVLPPGSGATQFAELNGYLEANAYTTYQVALTDPMKARLPMLIAISIYAIFFAVRFAPAIGCLLNLNLFSCFCICSPPLSYVAQQDGKQIAGSAEKILKENYKDNFSFVHQYGEDVLKLITVPERDMVADMPEKGIMFGALMVRHAEMR